MVGHQITDILPFSLRNPIMLGPGAYAVIPATREAKAGGSQVQLAI